MSLKAFHLFFVTVAALFSFAFAAWALLVRPGDGGSAGLGYFALGSAGGLVLAVWARKAARELRGEGAGP